jgi:hypothetical protein
MKPQPQFNPLATSRRRPWSERGKLIALVFAAGLMTHGATGTEKIGGNNGGNNICGITAGRALSAAQLEAQSDYQLALGKSANISDPAARNASLLQAKADYKDALATCKAQFAARLKVCDRLGGGPYDPLIAPSNFVSSVTNQFYPLTPGTTYYYMGQTAQGVESNVVHVTHNTKVILGVTNVEVHDVVYLGGELVEETLDWYAQDKEGNVWYFGEHSEQIVDGVIVGLEGSFIAGEDGAKPGIIMKASPAVGDFYRQEFLLKDAEDVAEVMSLNENVTVQAGSYSNCLKTEETSPLEPEALEHKYYAKGIGNILIVDEVTTERLELVRITH